MFERFTDRARRVFVLAQEEARDLNHNFIGTEHILLGFIHESDGVAAKALGSLGISLERVREKVGETIGPAGSSTAGAPFTPGAKDPRTVAARSTTTWPQLHRYRARAPSVPSGWSTKKVTSRGINPCPGAFCQVETLTEGALHGTLRPPHNPGNPH
jgi:Clp amino terminal domain, pathogenicity island component